MPYKLFAFLFFLLLLKNTSGQDIIVRSNNDTIRCLVVDMTKNKVKFIFNDVIDAQIFEIPKHQVKQIIFENGTKLTIVSNPYEVSKDLSIEEKSHAFKVDLFAPFLNHFTFSYEQKIKSGLNLELKAGLIATNFNSKLKHSEGFLAKAGVKFVSLTHSYLRGLKYIQPLNGIYLKPEIIFSSYTRDEDSLSVKYTNAGISILFGRQQVFKNKFSVDYFAGIGYGFQDAINDDDFSYAYSHVFFGKKFPLIVSGGVTVGIVF